MGRGLRSVFNSPCLPLSAFLPCLCFPSFLAISRLERKDGKKRAKLCIYHLTTGPVCVEQSSVTTEGFLRSYASLLCAVRSPPWSIWKSQLWFLGSISLYGWCLLTTACPPMQSFVRLTSRNPAPTREIFTHHHRINCWCTGFSCYCLLNLSAVLLCSNEHSAFRILVGSRHMSPKSKGWGGGPDIPPPPLYKFSNFNLISSNGRPRAGWLIQLIDKHGTRGWDVPAVTSTSTNTSSG